MYITIIKLRFSKLDHINLECLIEKWSTENPESKFHFQPYQLENGKETEARIDEMVDGSGHNLLTDNIHVIPEAKNVTKKFLFVHQNSWQKWLLMRYRNELCLLDATYHTTKYSLPLFFIVVKANVKYQVVGCFVTQDEKTDSILEALEIIKGWNPTWNPKFFMTDYCEEEISALERTFKGEITVNRVWLNFGSGGIFERESDFEMICSNVTLM